MPDGLWIAQAGAGSIATAVVLILVLLGAIVALGLVLMRLRRGFFGPEEDAEGDGVALPLDELRRLRDAGELSEAEFARAVEVIAASAKRADRR